MILIEIIISHNRHCTRSSISPLSTSSMSNLFESPLYTSNLYDSKQKSRSHLVLFETVDHSDGGRSTKKGGGSISGIKRWSNRQQEHCNAFGYLQGPVKFGEVKDFQSYDDLYDPTLSTSFNYHPHHPNHHQRTSTPLPPPVKFQQVIKTAASRNESSGVSAALSLESLNHHHHHEDNHHHQHSFGIYDDHQDVTTTSRNNQMFQKQKSIPNISLNRLQQYQSSSSMVKNPNDTVVGRDDGWRQQSPKQFKRLIRTTLPPPTTTTTSMPIPVKIQKQHELSPDNGSYFIPATNTTTTTTATNTKNDQKPSSFSFSLSSCQHQTKKQQLQPKSNFHRRQQKQLTNFEEQFLFRNNNSTLPSKYFLYNYPRISMSSDQQQQQSDQSSQNRILIKNGRLVNDDAIFKADIYVEDGIIKDIGPHLIVPGGVKTIDANGFYVLPGGIDTHTHMDTLFQGSKTADDYYSGTRAALAGGTTTIMDFVMTQKGQSLIEAFKKERSLSDGVACCDYALRLVVPEFVKGKTDTEMETLVKEHGVNSFKMFMCNKDVLMLRDEELINVLQKCQQLGALAMVHAENGDIIDFNVRKLKNLGLTGPEAHLLSRPEEVEAEATQRIIMLANQVNCPLYIVHLNSRSSADVVCAAKNRGNIVYGEAITAAIGTDGSHCFNKCWQHAAAFIMQPPLRNDKTLSEHFINLFANGQLNCLGSDHCCFTSDAKALGKNDFSKIPNGVNGVEERMMILWERGVKMGKLDPRQFVAATSTNAAKIFNLYPRKGRLAKGSDADIVIWGPKPHVISAQNHHFNGDFNIFEGTQVSYGPLVVISNGRVVLDENGLHVVQGSGRYLSLQPNSSYIWHSIRERERIPLPKVNRDGKPDEVDSASQSMPPPSSMPVPIGEQTNGSATIIQGTPPKYPPMINDPQQYSKDQNNGTPNFYKGTTRSGVRNLQDSSFSLSGAQIDDDKIGKTAIRVQNPPGGRSSGIW